MKQQIKAMLDDDRGVSPVIGVILMVAITVILAAVIGTFVLGLGDSLEQAPQATINVEDASDNYDSDTNDSVAFDISQDGGDGIPLSNVRFIVEGTDSSGQATFEQGSWTKQGTNSQVSMDLSDGTAISGQEFAVGDSLRVKNVGDVNSDGSTAFLTSGNEYRIRLVHIPSDSILLDTEVTLR